jgi:alpha-2-macroglobulin
VRAGHALLAMGAPDVRVFVDDRPLVLTAGQPFVDRKDGDGSARLPRLRNASDRPVYGFVDVLGQPSGAPPAEGHGFTVERRLFDRRGEPVDAERLRAGELVVVTLSGQYQGRGHAEALVVDYLPAGLELENIALGGAGSQDFAWVGATTQAGHVELRDDRYVASVSLDGNPGASSTFRLAYVARAVTAGRFAFGGASVAEMYQPERVARGPAGRLVVGAR